MTETTARNERRARRRGGAETGSAPEPHRQLSPPRQSLHAARASSPTIRSRRCTRWRCASWRSSACACCCPRRGASSPLPGPWSTRKAAWSASTALWWKSPSPRRRGRSSSWPASPDRSVVIGGRNLAVVPVAGPPHVTDTDRGKRPGTLADYEEFTKLAQHFDVIHLLGASVEPQDIPIQFRHLDVTRTQLTLGDKTPFVYARGPGQVRDCFEMIALGHGISAEAFAAPGPLLHRDQHQLPAPARYPDVPGHPRFRRGGAAPGHHPLHPGGRHGAGDHCRAR